MFEQLRKDKEQLYRRITSPSSGLSLHYPPKSASVQHPLSQESMLLQEGFSARSRRSCRQFPSSTTIKLEVSTRKYFLSLHKPRRSSHHLTKSKQCLLSTRESSAVCRPSIEAAVEDSPLPCEAASCLHEVLHASSDPVALHS